MKNEKECPECCGRGYYTTMGIGDNMDIDEEICEYCNGTGKESSNEE